MKKFVTVTAVFCAALTLASVAVAADEMAGMKMDNGAMSTAKPGKSQLTDAVVKEVDPSTGMVTLQHGALTNIGMSAMTMAYKAEDAAMIAHVKEGDKVKVRVEDVNGTLTIVKLEKP
jgi:Cu/Ag efflux protein CusF